MIRAEQNPITQCPQGQSVLISRLIRQKRNPNRMDEEQFKLLKKNIVKNGFLQPVLVRATAEGLEIIDGHHRVQAMEELGETTIQCILVHGISNQADVDALQLAMNKNRGQIDMNIAELILRELNEEGWSTEDLSSTGFTEIELETLLSMNFAEEASMGSGTIEESPDVAAKPFTLSIVFATKDQKDRVKKHLLAAAGGTKDLGLGLLNVLGEDV